MKISGAAAPSDAPTWADMTLEVAGGVLTWRVDDVSPAPPHLRLWAPEDAAWLWRVVGEAGHADTLAALAEHRDVEVAAVSEDLALLRRLAWGHWLRRWWPTSVIDGIEPLPSAVLDVEVALLIDDCESYFDADSLDGDPEALIARHPTTDIDSLARHFDPDVRSLHNRWSSREPDGEAVVTATLPSLSADDYALAAGSDVSAGPTPGIAEGRASVPWELVPANTFDAAEDTITWTVDAAPQVLVAIRVALLPGRSATPLQVELMLPDPPLRARATLDSTGRGRIPVDLTPRAAWRADWSTLSCTVGGRDGTEHRELRDRIRTLIRRRIGGIDDGTQLFVAEKLVADY